MVDKIVDNAVALITEQMDKYKKGQAERRAGRLMIKLCEANPSAAELIGQDIAQESMSLAKVTDKVRQAAKVQAKTIGGNECEYDDEDYLEIICTFYGIHEPMQSVETVIRVGVDRKVVSFMDLLGG